MHKKIQALEAELFGGESDYENNIAEVIDEDQNNLSSDYDDAFITQDEVIDLSLSQSLSLSVYLFNIR